MAIHHGDIVRYKTKFAPSPRIGDEMYVAVGFTEGRRQCLIRPLRVQKGALGETLIAETGHLVLA